MATWNDWVVNIGMMEAPLRLVLCCCFGSALRQRPKEIHQTHWNRRPRCRNNVVSPFAPLDVVAIVAFWWWAASGRGARLPLPRVLVVLATTNPGNRTAERK